MCVIVAKYFDEIGWVAVKNRDRNYTPEISFERINNKDGIERLLFEDDVTKYMEGINSEGVGILSASLMVQDDEKEITKHAKEKSPDGERIRRALEMPTAKSAAEASAKYQLTGNSVIIDREHCFLLESCNDANGDYQHVLREIPRDHTVARTNHGIWLQWAGYQRDPKNESGTLSRISSEARRLQAQAVVRTADDPEDLIDGLCQVYLENPQMNIMRTSTERKKMRTTAQIMRIPSEETMFVRPVSSHITFDFWKLNRPGADTWVEILSNRALYRKVRDTDPPFGGIAPEHQVDHS
jgi:hypothetical protein